MFTGIVEELGEVVAATDTGRDSALLAIRGPVVTADAGTATRSPSTVSA